VSFAVLTRTVKEGSFMRRSSPLILTISAVALAVAGASAVSAQEVGTDVPIVDAEGVEHGTVTVREIMDPFTDNDPNAPPAEGSRYVGLIVTYQAALDQSLDAQPYQVQLQGADGTIYPGQYVARPADVQIPDLQSQLMAPDNRISGFIGFIVPSEAVIDRVILAPSWDRMLDIADLTPDDGPALGDAVTYTNAAGATTTVSAGLVDPFTENDPAYPPAEGTRFVMVQPVFENSGEVPFYADPFDFYLRDATGLLVGPTTVYRPPEISIATLEAQTLSPGDRISGYVGFQVPADAAISDVLYFPESGRVATVAQVDGAAPSGGEAAAEESPAADG
jgi:hypothetical protein